MKNIIYVYAGPSMPRAISRMLMDNFHHAFHRHGFEVCPITPQEILDGRWMGNAFALVWGGGEATEFRKSLSIDNSFQKNAILEAHRNGTHFIGYCGGAYLGMDYITFAGSEDYRREGEGLGLLHQKSPGPVIGLTPAPYSSYSDSAAIVRLRHETTGKPFASLYCCGPYFPEESFPDNARVLATVTHPITGQDYSLGAQIPMTEGRGSVTLYGYHPDFTPDFIIKRNQETPSIPLHDARLQRETSESFRDILMGYNLMLYDLKTAMGIEFTGKNLILPPSYKPAIYGR